MFLTWTRIFLMTLLNWIFVEVKFYVLSDTLSQMLLQPKFFCPSAVQQEKQLRRSIVKCFVFRSLEFKRRFAMRRQSSDSTDFGSNVDRNSPPSRIFEIERVSRHLSKRNGQNKALISAFCSIFFELLYANQLTLVFYFSFRFVQISKSFWTQMFFSIKQCYNLYLAQSVQISKHNKQMIV